MSIQHVFIGIVCAASLLPGVGAGQAQQRSWPEGMAHGKRSAKSKYSKLEAIVQAPASKRKPTDSAKAHEPGKPKWTSHNPVHLTPDQEAAKKAFDERFGTDLRAVRQALATQRWGDAKQIMESRRRDFPWDNSLADLWADALLGEGRTSEAYDLLGPLAREGTMPRVLLRASLVAARLGEVYPGQARYCRQQVLEHFSAFEQEISRHLPQGDSPREVELLSLLAIGVESSFTGSLGERAAAFYLSLALGMENSNPIANFCLGNVLMWKGQAAAAVSRYERGLPRTAGLFRQHFEERLRDAIWVRDYRE